jgi:hypothetical protein
MAAMSNPLISYDPANDITHDVVHNLNTVYKNSGGPTAKRTAPAAGAAAGAAAAPPAAAPAAAAAAPRAVAPR